MMRERDGRREEEKEEEDERQEGSRIYYFSHDSLSSLLPLIYMTDCICL